MNYGEFLARVLDGILISYKEYSHYNGDYVAIIEKDHDWLIYKGYYGSCSGCDFLEGTRLFSEEDYGKFEEYSDEQDEWLKKCEILPAVKEEYLDEHPPFLVLPKSQVPDSVEDFIALLPANTRINFDSESEYASEDDVSYAAIFEQMRSFTLDNLLYLEKKYTVEEQKNGKPR